jgi:guanyl-specific ribonuclease Sa
MQHWVRLFAGLLLLAVAAYSVWQQRQAAPPPKPSVGEDRSAPSTSVDTTSRPPALTADRSASSDPTTESAATVIPAQTIYNLDGEVAYRGDVDVTATLARIKAGKLLRYGNDGSTFQNRERRLPRKPDGYYKEYVHPTPGLPGPGPQRIVMGENGEAYYTPDHYQSFRKLGE